MESQPIKATNASRGNVATSLRPSWEGCRQVTLPSLTIRAHTHPESGIARKAIGEDLKMDTVQELDTQELVDRIAALDCEFAKLKEVELLTQQSKDAIMQEAEECYTALYDILSRREGSYFQVGDSVVIINKNAHRDRANALAGHSVKVQPLTKI